MRGKKLLVLGLCVAAGSALLMCASTSLARATEPIGGVVLLKDGSWVEFDTCATFSDFSGDYFLFTDASAETDYLKPVPVEFKFSTVRLVRFGEEKVIRKRVRVPDTACSYPDKPDDRKTECRWILVHVTLTNGHTEQVFSNTSSHSDHLVGCGSRMGEFHISTKGARRAVPLESLRAIVFIP